MEDYLNTIAILMEINWLLKYKIKAHDTEKYQNVEQTVNPRMEWNAEKHVLYKHPAHWKCYQQLKQAHKSSEMHFNEHEELIFEVAPGEISFAPEKVYRVQNKELI